MYQTYIRIFRVLKEKIYIYKYIYYISFGVLRIYTHASFSHLIK